MVMPKKRQVNLSNMAWNICNRLMEEWEDCDSVDDVASLLICDSVLNRLLKLPENAPNLQNCESKPLKTPQTTPKTEHIADEVADWADGSMGGFD
jgi:hypothetical protein